ncbi:hypothetical protein AAVH_06474 [Aphelenchoides avenae]|nr:hypothetical protein AAVH_06474 [Aphelenchus avenae]
MISGNAEGQASLSDGALSTNWNHLLLFRREIMMAMDGGKSLDKLLSFINDQEEREEGLAKWSLLYRNAEDACRDRNDVFEAIVHNAADNGIAALFETMKDLLIEDTSSKDRNGHTLDRLLAKDMPPASRLLYDKFIDNPLYAGTAKLFTNALLNVLVPEQLCEELLKISPRVYAELVEAVKTMLEVKHAGRSYMIREANALLLRELPCRGQLAVSWQLPRHRPDPHPACQ